MRSGPTAFPVLPVMIASKSRDLNSFGSWKRAGAIGGEFLLFDPMNIVKALGVSCGPCLFWICFRLRDLLRSEEMAFESVDESGVYEAFDLADLSLRFSRLTIADTDARSRRNVSRASGNEGL